MYSEHQPEAKSCQFTSAMLHSRPINTPLTLTDTHPHNSITYLTPSIYRDGPIHSPNWYCSLWHAPAWGNVFITPIFPSWNTQPPLSRPPGMHDTLHCWRPGNENDDDRSSYSPWVLPTKASHVSACWGKKWELWSQGCAGLYAVVIQRERESCVTSSITYHLGQRETP